MANFVIIMGKSSSGKDTIFKELVRNTNLIPIVPYSTRPIREGEKNGVDYFFVDEDYFKNNKEKVIECRTYKTIHGDWSYGEILDDQIDLESDNTYIIILTLEGYIGFSKFFSNKNIFPVYINVENGLRLQRALSREMKEKNPKYKELCRRFLADEEDFSSDNLKNAGITKIFENINISDTVTEISNYLISNDVKL